MMMKKSIVLVTITGAALVPGVAQAKSVPPPTIKQAQHKIANTMRATDEQVTDCVRSKKNNRKVSCKVTNPPGYPPGIVRAWVTRGPKGNWNIGFKS